MAAIETTSVQSATSTPMRRTSWKDDTDQYQPLSGNEKYLSQGSTNNPFDCQQYPTQASPTNPPVADIEAQYPRTKTRLTYKALACTTLTCMIVVWLLFIAGILMLTDNFPDPARGYQVLKNIDIHTIDTKAAVDVVKSQVGKLYGYMEGYGFMNGFGSMNFENGTEVDFNH